MTFFSKSIKKRLMASCIILVSIPVIILGITNYYSARTQVYEEAEQMIQQQVRSIRQNADNTFQLVQLKVKSDLKVARFIMDSYGRPEINDRGELILTNKLAEEKVQQRVASDLIVAHSMIYSEGKPVINRGRRTRVIAENQITHEKKEVEIPVMRIASREIAFNYDLVDKITETTGVQTATIFQVIPGGLLRISTNVRKLDGKRAVGTYIPEGSAVYQTVMRGETFYGRAWVVNAWFKTAYEPIFDYRRRVIGVLYVGEKESTHIVNNNFEIVDKIKQQIGGTATLFQLKSIDGKNLNTDTLRNWRDDQAMFRVSTNVKKLDGKRAIGTILSKPVYDIVMKGETYFGRAWVVNDWYTTAYEPLKDSNGKICGILYVGVREKDYQAVLLNQISQTTIENRGHIIILNEKGDYVLSPHKVADGKSALDIRDADGKAVFEDIILNSKEIKNDKTIIEYRSWKGQIDDREEDKLVAYSRFSNWGWIILANVYEDDFTSGLNMIALTTFLISLAGILFGILISYLISTTFIKPINQIVAFIGNLAACRFSNRIEMDSQDEIGIIARELNKMVDSLEHAFGSIGEVLNSLQEGDLTLEIQNDLQGDLNEIGNNINTSVRMFREMIRQVAQSGDEFSSNAEEMSQLANSLSAGSSQQAAGIKEISSSMEEVGAQAKANEESAGQTQALTEHVRHEVAHGNNEMEIMVESMGKVQTASSEVSNVVEVINGISKKTELLALNAAVEAARAGANGKGFAVVAEEIRSLANRSSEAVKDTTVLIQHSLSEVENGVQVTERAAQALATIDQRVEEVTGVIQMILQGSREQRQGIDEIAAALTQVNTVVQNNSSISEKTADESIHLLEQASELKKEMKQFKL